MSAGATPVAGPDGASRVAAQRPPSARRRRHVGRAAAALAAASLGACAYFNGVYNAKETTRSADRLARRGQTAEAAQQYATAAATAETVLARYPKSRWRADALYLAGRGAALSNGCATAEPRLTEYLALPHQPGARRDRAALALASCAVAGARFSEARALAAPLLGKRHKDLATAAARVVARAALELGQTGEAERVLAALPAAEAQWELASSALEREDYARAESLLVLRAQRGDVRDQLVPALQSLWAAHRYDGVERIVDAYAGARTRSSTKIALHLLAADLLMAADRDSAARAHLLGAARIAVDSLTEREIGARLTLLDLATRPGLGDVDATVRAAGRRNRGTALQRRLEDNLLLVHLFELRQDFSGASLFLAAEVARDSLRARALAHTLFTRVTTSYPESPLAPKALIAAAALRPDSASAYQARMRTQFAASPYSMILMGSEPSDTSAMRRDEALLRQTWRVVTGIYADTLAKLHPVGARGPAGGGAGAPPNLEDRGR